MSWIDCVYNYVISGGTTGCAEKKPESRRTPEKTCRANYDAQSTDYHYCLLEENFLIHEAFRQKNISRAEEHLEIISEQPGRSPEGGWTAIKKKIAAAARHINYQTDNELLLAAARKTLYLFNITQELNYLAVSQQLVNKALANVDYTKNFDAFHLFPSNWRNETIYPIESYFDLRITEIQILNITNPMLASKRTAQLEQELRDPRFLKARGSKPASAEGYLNRLHILSAYGGIYNPLMPTITALKFARQAHKWASQKHADSNTDLALLGMNKKDLRYDMLLSRILEGRLLTKLGRRNDDTLEIFKSSLNEAEAVKKYGGFLDIGLQAFYNIILIDLSNSSSLREASEKIASHVKWDDIANSPTLADLREALGLTIRKSKYRDRLSEALQVNLDDVNPLGVWSLRFDIPQLSPAVENDAAAESKLPFKQMSARAKLDTIIQLLDYVEFPRDQKEEIIEFYNSLRELEGDQ